MLWTAALLQSPKSAVFIVNYLQHEEEMDTRMDNKTLCENIVMYQVKLMGTMRRRKYRVSLEIYGPYIRSSLGVPKSDHAH